MNQSWIEYFMGLAEYASIKSKDKSTKVGAVIVAPDLSVRSTGFNGFPRGTNDDDAIYLDRPRKLLRVAHAEINAIAQAAKSGTQTDGCGIVVNFHPCSQCAAAIINAGIKMVVCPPIPEQTQWKESFTEAASLLSEAGITVVYHAKE